MALLAAYLLQRFAPSRTTMLGLRDAQRNLAQRSGADEFLTASTGERYDVVIEAAGHVDAVSTALSSVARGGSVTLLGLPPHGAQVGLDVGVTARRDRLALERTHLTTDLAHEVAQTLDVLLGRGESAFGAFLAPSVLQDAGRLFDDRATILRRGVEDRVQLALTDDHVLLAPDAGVTQQFLHVEQSTGRPVDGVLGVAGAKERARDRDLGAVDRQLARGVVQGERHFGATERRAIRRAHEDDVVHLRAT